MAGFIVERGLSNETIPLSLVWGTSDPDSHLQVLFVPPLSGAQNLHDRYGGYYVFSAEAGDIRNKRAVYAIPPYELTHLITSGPGDTEPVAVELPSGRIVLLFTRNGANVYETYSDDQGDTWSTPAMAIANGTHPAIAVSRDGLVIRAAVVAGEIVATLQEPGDAAPGSPFTFKDDAGVDLAVEDDVFGLSWAPDAPGRLLLHVRIAGGSDTSDFYSADCGLTWTEIP